MSRASPRFLTKLFYFRSRGLNGQLDPTIRRLVSWQAKEDYLKNAIIRAGSTAEEQDRAPGEVTEGAIAVTVDRAAKVQRRGWTRRHAVRFTGCAKPTISNTCVRVGVN